MKTLLSACLLLSVFYFANLQAQSISEPTEVLEFEKYKLPFSSELIPLNNQLYYLDYENDEVLLQRLNPVTNDVSTVTSLPGLNQSRVLINYSDDQIVFQQLNSQLGSLTFVMNSDESVKELQGINRVELFKDQFYLTSEAENNIYLLRIKADAEIDTLDVVDDYSFTFFQANDEHLYLISRPAASFSTTLFHMNEMSQLDSIGTSSSFFRLYSLGAYSYYGSTPLSRVDGAEITPITNHSFISGRENGESSIIFGTRFNDDDGTTTNVASLFKNESIENEYTFDNNILNMAMTDQVAVLIENDLYAKYKVWVIDLTNGAIKEINQGANAYQFLQILSSDNNEIILSGINDQNDQLIFSAGKNQTLDVRIDFEGQSNGQFFAHHLDETHFVFSGQNGDHKRTLYQLDRATEDVTSYQGYTPFHTSLGVKMNNSIYINGALDDAQNTNLIAIESTMGEINTIAKLKFDVAINMRSYMETFDDGLIVVATTIKDPSLAIPHYYNVKTGDLDAIHIPNFNFNVFATWKYDADHIIIRAGFPAQIIDYSISNKETRFHMQEPNNFNNSYRIFPGAPTFIIEEDELLNIYAVNVDESEVNTFIYSGELNLNGEHVIAQNKLFINAPDKLISIDATSGDADEWTSANPAYLLENYGDEVLFSDGSNSGIQSIKNNELTTLDQTIPDDMGIANNYLYFSENGTTKFFDLQSRQMAPFEHDHMQFSYDAIQANKTIYSNVDNRYYYLNDQQDFEEFETLNAHNIITTLGDGILFDDLLNDEYIVYYPDTSISIDDLDTDLSIRGLGVVDNKLYTLGTKGDVVDYKLYVYDVDDATTSLAKISNVEEINVFPNPASDYIQLKHNRGIQSINIFSTSGRLIRTVSNKNGQYYIGDLNPGTYFLSTINTKSIFTGRFIKAK